MENSLLYNLPFDPLILIIGFSVLSFVLLVVVIICIIKMNKLYRRYDMFMRGKDAETLEDTILDILDELQELRARDRTNKDAMKLLSRQVKSSFQKYGFVKYNAFKGMGGNLSFVLAMLDDNNSGFVLDAVHSREGCYLYLKEVEEGATEVLLGSEEQEALEQALGYVKRASLSEKLEKSSSTVKERSHGSGQQAIEIPNRERRKSERMKELRRRQQEEDGGVQQYQETQQYREPEEDYLDDTEDDRIEGEY